jgi:hypothetical protein
MRPFLVRCWRGCRTRLPHAAGRSETKRWSHCRSAARVCPRTTERRCTARRHAAPPPRPTMSQRAAAPHRHAPRRHLSTTPRRHAALPRCWHESLSCADDTLCVTALRPCLKSIVAPQISDLFSRSKCSAASSFHCNARCAAQSDVCHSDGTGLTFCASALIFIPSSPAERPTFYHCSRSVQSPRSIVDNDRRHDATADP